MFERGVCEGIEPRQEIKTLVEQFNRGIAYESVGGERAKRGCCLRGTDPVAGLSYLWAPGSLLTPWGRTP